MPAFRITATCTFRHWRSSIQQSSELLVSLILAFNLVKIIENFMPSDQYLKTFCSHKLVYFYISVTLCVFEYYTLTQHQPLSV